MNLIKKLFNSNCFLILVIVILGFSSYSSMLGGDFKSLDDYTSIINNEKIRSFSDVQEILTTSFFGVSSYYRPLVYLGYMLEYHFFGPNAFYFYAVNLSLHIFNAVLVFFLVNIILKNKPASFFTALLFVLHPVHWEAVTNIAGRSILLCAFWYFLALILYTAKENKFLYVLSLCCFVLALMSKESALTLILILLNYELFVSHNKLIQKSAMIRLSPYAFAALLYLMFRASIGITNVAHWVSLKGLFLGVTTFVRGAFTYLRLLVFPVDLHADRSIPYFTSPADPQLILTLLGAGLISTFVYKNRRKIPQTNYFFLFWPVLTFVLVSQVIPLPVQHDSAALSEHFLYIPSVGLFVMMVSGFSALMKIGDDKKIIKKGVACFLIVGIYLYFSLITVQQSIYSSREFAILKRSLKYNPDNVRLRNSYGLAFAYKGLYKKAEDQFRLSLDKNPHDPVGRIGLGKVLMAQGKVLEAMAEYEKVRFPGIQEKVLRDNKTMAYHFAVSKYKESLKEDPQNARLYFSIGVMYSKLAKSQEALEAYKRAVEIDPSLKDAYFNIASHYEAENHTAEAIHYYNQLLTAEGEKSVLDYYAYLQLSRIYEKLGDLQSSKNSKKAAESLKHLMPEESQFINLTK